MPRATKVKNAGDKPYPKTKVPKKGTGGYDRSVMVAEVAKATKADFARVAEQIGKTVVQCKDTLRKTVLPALLAGGEWCTTGSGWTAEMKLTLVVEVFSTATPDWAHIASLFDNKTATQAKDMWRKVLYPKIAKGKCTG